MPTVAAGPRGYRESVSWTVPRVLVVVLMVAACSRAAPPSMAAESEPMPAAAAPERTSASTPVAGSQGVESRHLVVEVDMAVEVANLDTFREDLLAVVAKLGGHVSDAQRSGRAGASRHASWTIRVPSARHEALVAEIEALGELTNASTSTQDVTAQVIDVDARIKSLQTAETRMLELVATQAGALSDVLAIERELARVRGEIESLQGQQRALRDRVALATIRVQAWERAVYDPAVATTFGERASRTLWRSWKSAVATVEALVLALIGLVPWSPAIVAVVALGFVWRRRRRRRRAAHERTA